MENIRSKVQANVEPTLGRGLPSRSLLIIAVAGGFLVVPPVLGEGASVRALGVLTFALILWITQAVETTVTALSVLVMLPALGVLSFDRTLAGFAAPSLWLLVAVFVLSAVTRTARLDIRLAIGLLRLTRGRPGRVVGAVVVLLLMLLFIIPTSSGRASMATPIAQGIARAMRLEPGSALGKVLFLAIPFVSLVSSTAILTGAVAAIYASEFFLSTLGHTLTWSSWALAAFPGAMIAALLVGPILWMLFRPAAVQLPELDTYLAEYRIRLGPIGGAEFRLAMLLVVLVTGFALSGPLHLSVELLALACAVFALAPIVGIVSWKLIEHAIAWDVLILYGAGLALSQSLSQTHAFDGLLTVVGPTLRPLDPALVAAITMVMLAVVRLAFTSVVAMVAAVLPFMLALASQLGLNPIWLGLVTVVAADLCLLLPTQTVAGAVSYSAGFYSIRDMALAGLPISMCLIVLTVLLARFYWPLVGIPILGTP